MKRREPYMIIKYRLLNLPVIKSDYQFINKLDQLSKSNTLGAVMITGSGSKINDKWRMQQQVFREAVDAAKKGKLQGDGTIDDRVPCRYCGRKFAAKAAERHIPICKNKNS